MRLIGFRVDPIPMSGDLQEEKEGGLRCRDAQGRRPCEVETEVGMTRLQAEECRGLPDTRS